MGETAAARSEPPAVGGVRRVVRLPGERDRPFRPIQYLGNKQRSLDAVAAAARELAPGGTALDLFSGTSVVSQALARAGFTVTAVDQLGFAAQLARALLGVGRRASERDVGPLVARACERARGLRARGLLDRWEDAERRAIAAKDGAALVRISRSVPQIWRRAGAGERLRLALDRLSCPDGRAPAPPAIAATHYAGTYFGVGQALDLDALRAAIARLREEGAASAWQEAVMLAALLAAASDCSFSPGKHFAQPHKLGGKGRDSTAFVERRIVSDRSVGVAETFARRAGQIAAAAPPADAGHRALAVEVEALVAAPERVGPVDLVYADPPYTAQQYSRFYHVLEVLSRQAVPRLQRVKGRVTAGIYPEGRYLSRFCSKRSARAAFADLVALADALGADLLLSYSGSASGVSGNDRMIDLDDLVELCAARVGRARVTVATLGHAYRQFNSDALAVGGRLDHEYLVARRARC